MSALNPVRLLPGPGQHQGVGGPLRCPPGLVGGVPDSALGKHRQGVGLKLAGARKMASMRSVPVVMIPVYSRYPVKSLSSA